MSMLQIPMTDLRVSGLSINIYRSYMVRFWQSSEQGCWRASAQCVQTGNTVLFGDIETLFAFLQGEIEKQLSKEKNTDQ